MYSAAISKRFELLFAVAEAMMLDRIDVAWGTLVGVALGVMSFNWDSTSKAAASPAIRFPCNAVRIVSMAAMGLAGVEEEDVATVLVATVLVAFIVLDVCGTLVVFTERVALTVLVVVLVEDRQRLSTSTGLATACPKIAAAPRAREMLRGPNILKMQMSVENGQEEWERLRWNFIFYQGVSEIASFDGRENVIVGNMTR